MVKMAKLENIKFERTDDILYILRRPLDMIKHRDPDEMYRALKDTDQKITVHYFPVGLFRVQLAKNMMEWIRYGRNQLYISINDKEINFCPQCGSNIGGIKTKLAGFKRRAEFKIQDKITQVKSSVDTQIAQYLEKIDNQEDVTIAGKSIPENRKESIRNALIGFQSRLGTDQVEVSEEFNQWLKDLQSRLDEEKCIVCFQKWTRLNETVVICKHCRSGGHQNHLFGWIEEKKFCPLCRQSLTKRDLISINLSN